MENKDTCKYSYSAKQYEEIARIRNKYLSPEEDKIETLRRLDRSTSNKANMFSLALGIIGVLVLGIGMSSVMVWDLLIVGTAIGVLGMVIISLAYPVYKMVLKRERERIAPEILRLTDELMK